ncbi:MAG: hypothetical protein E3J64_07025 [Anaerolineales bacterium]|nr:MAG: hypothetical protein E3J64_07025 [Anaerolineales bacterium]
MRVGVPGGTAPEWFGWRGSVQAGDRSDLLPSYRRQPYRFGLARIRCRDCGHETIIPLSCRRRGLCPAASRSSGSSGRSGCWRRSCRMCPVAIMCRPCPRR